MEIVSDFDGTIVSIDAVEYLLAQFANGDWRKYDDQYERGEITLEQCLRLQYRMIKEPKERLLDAVDGVATFRTGFDELLAFCKENRIPFTIVSAGLDFVIRHLLHSRNMQNRISVLAPKSRPAPQGIGLDFSGLPKGYSSNFKSSLVQSIKAKRVGVVYIGDGFSDFEAIKVADFRFAVRDSRLAEQCKKYDVLCHEFIGLEEVTWYLIDSGVIS